MEPAGKIAPQGWMGDAPARAVLAALGAGGASARFVGGCVRDAILGREVKDIDIATPEPPDRVMQLLREAGIRVVPTGIDHGTVTAVLEGAHYEITTLRHDVETFGRHARVAFTDDWANDAARRDFTINAMFCDADGTLYDPTGGLADLKAGRVRFVGKAEERIREDVLRLLRFFRFHGYYGAPPPDAAALAACRARAPDLARLSAERVWSELRRLLQAPDPAAILALMDRNGVLGHVLAEATRIDRLAALVRLEGICGRAADTVLRLAAVIDADADEAETVARRLRMANADRRRLVALAAPETRPIPALDARARRIALYRLGAALFTDLTLLGWAGAVAARADESDDAGWRALAAAADGWRPVSLPVAGRDAVALGIPRGPEVGRLVGEVEAWWVAQDLVPDRAACLARLKDLVRGAKGG